MATGSPSAATGANLPGAAGGGLSGMGSGAANIIGAGLSRDQDGKKQAAPPPQVDPSADPATRLSQRAGKLADKAMYTEGGRNRLTGGLTRRGSRADEAAKLLGASLISGGAAAGQKAAAAGGAKAGAAGAAGKLGGKPITSSMGKLGGNKLPTTSPAGKLGGQPPGPADARFGGNGGGGGGAFRGIFGVTPGTSGGAGRQQTEVKNTSGRMSPARSLAVIVAMIIAAIVIGLTGGVGGGARSAQIAYAKQQAELAAGNDCSGVHQAGPLPSVSVLPVGTTIGALSAIASNNAAIITQVAWSKGLGDEGAIIGIAAAMAESGLQNYANDGTSTLIGSAEGRQLNDAERAVARESLKYPHDAVGNNLDSIGLFQQRPMTGWGDPEELINPVGSSTKFFDALISKVPNWRSLSPGVAAQTVQGSPSGDGGIYTIKIPEATSTVEGLKQYIKPGGGGNASPVAATSKVQSPPTTSSAQPPSNPPSGGNVAQSTVTEPSGDEDPSVLKVPIGSAKEITAAGVKLNATQVQVAIDILTVAREQEVPLLGWYIGVATSMQESTLGNPNHGDGPGPSSRGTFQQMPGWGSEADRMDVKKSAYLFYRSHKGTGANGLMFTPGWKSMSLASAAQAVQLSDFPDAYAQWEDMARDLVKQLTNGADAGLGDPGTVNVDLAAFTDSQDPSSFGWKAGNDAKIVPYTWNGIEVVGGVADGTQALWSALLNELNPSIPGGITTLNGYENRSNVNSPDKLSFHAYGIAVDVNYLQNPNGANPPDGGQGVIPDQQGTDLAKKYGMIWGGNFLNTPDPMHFEIHVPPSAISASKTPPQNCPQGGGGASGGTVALNGPEVTVPAGGGALAGQVIKSPNAVTAKVIARGLGQLGVTYAWGGGTPDGPSQGIRDGGVADAHGDYNKIGFDCSGLMLYSWSVAGVTLGHYTQNQYASGGTQVPVDQAVPGDMLFFSSSAPNAGGIHHVAMYLGEYNGTKYMLEAPQSGDVVKVSTVRTDGELMPMAVRPQPTVAA